GRVEGPCLGYLGHDRLLEGLELLPFRLRRLGEFLLLLVDVEDSGPVLRTAVAELAVSDRRIVVHPEDVKQLVVAHFRWIERHLDRFGVPRAPAGDLLIAGTLDAAAGITRNGRHDAGHVLEGFLRAPEATRSK